MAGFHGYPAIASLTNRRKADDELRVAKYRYVGVMRREDELPKLGRSRVDNLRDLALGALAANTEVLVSMVRLGGGRPYKATRRTPRHRRKSGIRGAARTL